MAALGGQVEIVDLLISNGANINATILVQTNLINIFDLIKKGYFNKNSRILALHTGGMQGVAGMNLKLKKKNLPLINV